MNTTAPDPLIVPLTRPIVETTRAEIASNGLDLSTLLDVLESVGAFVPQISEALASPSAQTFLRFARKIATGDRRVTLAIDVEGEGAAAMVIR